VQSTAWAIDQVLLSKELFGISGESTEKKTVFKRVSIIFRVFALGSIVVGGNLLKLCAITSRKEQLLRVLVYRMPLSDKVKIRKMMFTRIRNVATNPTLIVDRF